MLKRRAWQHAAAATLATTLIMAGCSSDGDSSSDETTTTAADTAAPVLSEQTALAVATTHADLASAAYVATVDSATQMQTAIGAFVADPTDETLEAAKQSWLDARDVYGPTEVFRFSDGPIDNPDDGPEGQINAWPMDEAYVDYVDGDETAGIINDPEGVPEITREVLVAANEDGGETNISTGWHAVEFLLWGQDLDENGPGARPVTDYMTSEVAERRATYLTEVTDLLVDDLQGVADQWDATDGAYRSEFLADPEQAVSDILRGMGALSSGELAGERLAVAYETREQEDEHSCFADNTNADVTNNAKGIQMAYLADYPGVSGTTLSDAVAEVDPDLDQAMQEELAANVELAESVAEMGTFEEIIRSDEDSTERAEMLKLIENLQAQGDSIAEVGAALGYSISIEI